MSQQSTFENDSTGEELLYFQDFRRNSLQLMD
jgi:hypothetical protein